MLEHVSHVDMILRALTGWYAFIALMVYIHDRRSYVYRTPGALGVQTLAFGLFWYSTVAAVSAVSIIGKQLGFVSHWFVPKFASGDIWFYLMLGDVIVNLSIGSIALACRMTTSTKKGRRYLHGRLE